jgi:SAM-dependent methyltransferase
MTAHESETAEFWRGYGHDDLVVRVAQLHTQRRELAESLGAVEIKGARNAVAHLFLKGQGIEVGAGDRPFPLPDGAQCHYGDTRDRDELNKYFKNDRVSFSGFVDAQTYAGVPAASLDFVIAAHVIEHLFDPVGAIRAAIRVLKPGGVFVCVVPDMEKTWDRNRPPVTVEHLLADSLDGGAGTRAQAYEEHMRYVHPVITGKHVPEEEIVGHIRHGLEQGSDIHVHAWRAVDFTELLRAIMPSSGFKIEGHVSVVNENIYVLRRV